MPANHLPQSPAASTPSQASPIAKGTAKYTNKDGSKYITVPKANKPNGSAQPSPTAHTSAANARNDTQATAAAQPDELVQPVNRKKQKRRAKAAAKAAAEQALNHETSNGLPSPPASHEHQSFDLGPDYSDDDGEQYSESNGPHAHQNGFAEPPSSKGKKPKKKKKRVNMSMNSDEAQPANSPQMAPESVFPGTAPSLDPRRPGISKEKIWNTSSQEERERIKEFWLGLGEDERKSLVKVEKDAVLKKMKEQQKHTCSCTVCGRKRTAIEEELEGLYDAYYQELEQYATQPNQGDPPMLGGAHRPFGPLGGTHPRGLPSNYSNHHQPSHGRIIEHMGDEEDDEGDEEYSDEDELEEDDEYSDEEPSEDLHRNDYASDFFNFGNSLTVQGGILTVADDLLKNDGKKFIEMMEQLAERRMAREEDAREQYERTYGHPNGDRYGHNHAPAEEEEYDDEEEEYEEDEEDDYDSQEEEEDNMTEEQRMEEGRRMFQIFAARMFEQRVLTAYREKIAKERQQKLLEELEDEDRLESERRAKKAKEAQKRKDRAAKKKEAQAEEKARREAERAAEEAARLAEEAQKAEEARQRAEEKRKKREAQKKAEEEERLRKEAERQRRQHELREKQAEQERKAREAKEREKKARETKEKDARERKEREARERKEQNEREKREKDARVKAEREARETKERDRKKQREERAAQKAAALATSIPITLVKRPAQPSSNKLAAAVPALPQQPPTAFASPQLGVATPALPKAPTPIRRRPESQAEADYAPSSQSASQSGSGPSQNPSPHSTTPVHASPNPLPGPLPGPIGPPSKAGSVPGAHGPLQQSSQAASPLTTAARATPTQPSPFGSIPPLAVPFPPGLPQMPPGFGNRMPHEPIFPSGFRPGPPGMVPMPPPGLNGPMGGGRGFPMHATPPGFGQSMELPLPGIAPLFNIGIPKDQMSSHSRQPSASFEPATPAQPISRPAPIGRPASVVHGQWPPSASPASGAAKSETEDHHLGSSALLDDSEEALQEDFGLGRRGGTAPGPRPGPAFPINAFGMDAVFGSPHNVWASPAQSNPFGPAPPPGFGHVGMPAPWGMPQPPASTFGMQGGLGRPSEPRTVAVRKMICRACEELSGGNAEPRTNGARLSAGDGFIFLEAVKTKVEQLNQGNPVAEKELLDICDTEGNASNGGGTFDVRQDSETGQTSIRFVSGDGRSSSQPFLHRFGAPGEISSPVVGVSSFAGSSR